MNQTFNVAGATVEVRTGKNHAGERVARITYPDGLTVQVPAEVCALGAGRDAWMKDILFKCNDCGERAKASVLYDELPGSCPACAEKFFHCDRCGSTHHPDDPCPTKYEKHQTN